MPEKNANVPNIDVLMQEFSSALETLERIGNNLTPDTIEEYGNAAKEVKSKLVTLAENGIRMSGNVEETIIVYEDGTPCGEVKMKTILKNFSQDDVVKIASNLDEWALYDEDSDENDDLTRIDGDVVESDPMIYNMWLPPYMQGMYPQPGQAFKPPAHPKAPEIVKELGELQQKIYMMESTKNAAKERNYRLKQNLSSLEDEKANLTQKLQEATDELKATTKSYEERIAALNSQLEKSTLKEKQLSEEIRELKIAKSEYETRLRNELATKSAELTSKNTELEQLNKLLLTTQADYEKLSDSYKNRIDELEKQLKDALNSSEAKKLRERSSSLQSNLDKVTTERDALQKKLANSEADNRTIRESAANTEKSLKKEIEDLKQKDESTRAELEKLTGLAYTDTKTGVKNHNAFNRDYPTYEITKDLCLSIINICGVKDVNETHGRKAGDALIKIVAERLIEFFGTETVYKIFGGEFIVIHKEAEYNKICFALADIQKNLAMEDIKVIYGVSTGEYTKSRQELLQTAEKSMDNMRKDKTGIFDPIDSARQRAKGQAEEISIDLDDDADGLADGLSQLEDNK